MSSRTLGKLTLLWPLTLHEVLRAIYVDSAYINLAFKAGMMNLRQITAGTIFSMPMQSHTESQQ